MTNHGVKHCITHVGGKQRTVPDVLGTGAAHFSKGEACTAVVVVSKLTLGVTTAMDCSLSVTWVTDAARAMCSITSDSATKSITRILGH